MKTPIAIAKGDGIGPEIMDATLFILNTAGAQLELHEVKIGEKMYLKGFPTGMDPKTWDVICHTKAFLKAPITTPNIYKEGVSSQPLKIDGSHSSQHRESENAFLSTHQLI
jgi:isocitrate/isopropylmalate dehydrogenase